jgi:hypothetical protein
MADMELLVIVLIGIGVFLFSVGIARSYELFLKKDTFIDDFKEDK